MSYRFQPSCLVESAVTEHPPRPLVNVVARCLCVATARNVQGPPLIAWRYWLSSQRLTLSAKIAETRVCLSVVQINYAELQLTRWEANTDQHFHKVYH